MIETRSQVTNSSSSAAARIALPAQDEDVVTLRRTLVAKLTYAVGKDPIVASDGDWFVATALTVRDRIVDRWMPSTRAIYLEGRKRVYYLSQEFLIGRLLFDSLNNLGLTELVRTALAELGADLDRLRNVEPDPALGNGGLGRLAACFMESMATLSIAAYGYGIRYDHGLFRQAITDGWPRIGFRSVTPGSSNDQRSLTQSALAGSSKPSERRATPRGGSGIRPRLCRPLPMTRRWLVGAVGTSTLCACGRHVDPIHCALTHSMAAIMSAHMQIG
jgi:carbohydrate phosphorylase